MGTTISVKLSDLNRVGCKTEVHRDETDSEFRWVEVILPDGRSIHSSSTNCLRFECRQTDYSPTAWMVRWLIDNNVPYTDE